MSSKFPRITPVIVVTMECLDRLSIRVEISRYCRNGSDSVRIDLRVDTLQAVAQWKFYAVVGILAAIDTVIALLWVVLDPLERSEEDVHDADVEVPKNSTLEDVKIDSKLEHCNCKYMTIWTGE